jgi:hypothetical protein
MVLISYICKMKSAKYPGWIDKLPDSVDKAFGLTYIFQNTRTVGSVCGRILHLDRSHRSISLLSDELGRRRSISLRSYPLWLHIVDISLRPLDASWNTSASWTTLPTHLLVLRPTHTQPRWQVLGPERLRLRPWSSSPAIVLLAGHDVLDAVEAQF